MMRNVALERLLMVEKTFKNPSDELLNKLMDIWDATMREEVTAGRSGDGKAGRTAIKAVLNAALKEAS